MSSSKGILDSDENNSDKKLVFDESIDGKGTPSRPASAEKPPGVEAKVSSAVGKSVSPMN